MRFKFESATASLRQFDTSVPWVLSSVFSRDRGKGHATGLMEQIVAYADEHDIEIQLLVKRFKYTDSKALDNEQLRAFYEKFGFEWDGEKSLPLRMIRECKVLSKEELNL